MKQSRILLATVLLTLMLSGCSADPADPAVPKTGELQSEFADIGLALAEFQETENAQAKGGIRLEDTGIDNPVFQGQDNEFYLRLGDDGAYSIWGCYYADFECRLTDELSRCTIIYGHSSLNDETEGERFTELKKLNIGSFAEDHRYFFFATGGKEYVATIFSVGYWPNSSQYLYANPTDPAFEELLEDARARSIYNYDVEVGLGDKIIILSTCTGSEEERYVVMAKLSDAYEGKPGDLEINPTPKGA